MKKFLYGFIGAVVLLLVVVVIAVSLVDTNSIKQLIISKTKQATGRELVIDGDLSWRFFPSLGFQLGALRLLDHPDFGSEDTLSIDGAEMSVSVLPLFSKNIEVGDIRVSGLSLRYQVNADGSSNFDDLSQSKPAAGPAASTSSEASESPGTASQWNIRLSGIEVSDANIALLDLRTNKNQTLGPINFKLAGLELDKENHFELSSQYTDGVLSVAQQAQGILLVSKDFSRLSIKALENSLKLQGESLPHGEMNITSSLDLDYLVEQKTAELSSFAMDIDEQTQINGSSRLVLSEIPKLSFDFNIPVLDTSAFMASAEKPQVSGGTKTETTSTTEQEPDLSALKSINVDGVLSITKLQHQKLHLENIKQHLVIANGVLTLKQLSAELYGGKLSSNAVLNGQQKLATYSLSAQLSGVEALPLLSDAADFEFIAGHLNVDMALKGKGLTPTAVKKVINGPINARFTDGAIYGINIPQMIRTAKASLQGGDKQQAQQEQKTDFSELMLKANLGQSFATLNKMEMVSPLLRIEGTGKTQLLKETLDFSFITKVVASLEGQGSSNDLAGIDIPLKVAGSWSKPKVQLDMQKLFEGQAKEALNKELNKALGGDTDSKKLLDSLGGFFKK